MPIDDVFAESVPGSVGEVLWELPVPEHDAGDTSDSAFAQKVYVILAESVVDKI